MATSTHVGIVTADLVAFGETRSREEMEMSDS